MALLPLLVLFSAWLILVPREEAGPVPPGWRRAAFIKALLLTWAFMALLTEALSLLGGLTPAGMMISWALAFLGLLAYGWRTGRLAAGARVLVTGASFMWPGWAALAVCGLFLAALALLAWLSPPNNNDSLFYHMARVMHWAQNGSLAHYSTAIESQLWNPPGAEYAILNLLLLAGGDRLANFVQWFSLIACLVATSLVALELGASRFGQWLAALLALTLPMAVLQATSTQNDLVTSVWVLSLAYFTVRAHFRALSLAEWTFTSLSVALGALTKGTFYAYALPLLTWLLVSTVRRSGWRASARYAALGACLLVLLNAAPWLRNVSAYGSPMGSTEAIREIASQKHTPAAVLSTLTRNTATQMAVIDRIPGLDGANERAVDAIHGWLNLDPNDPDTSMADFSILFSLTSEDYASNPAHFVLALVAILLSFVRARRCPAAAAYAGALIVAYIIFAALYQWQPWGGRLLLPFFMLAVPLTAFWLERPLPINPAANRWIGTAVTAGLLLIAVRPLLWNSARPLVGPANARIDPRQELVFRNSPEWRDPYMDAAVRVKEAGCRFLGLSTSYRDPEYPLWVLLSPDARAVQIEHIQPAQLPPSGSDRPCAVLSAGYMLGRFDPPGYTLAKDYGDFQLYLDTSSVTP